MVVGGTDVSEVSDGQGLAGEVGWDGDGNVDLSSVEVSPSLPVEQSN